MSNERILVVDDEKSLLEVVSYALNEAGFKVATAMDVKRAQEAMKKFEPDLLILDIMLPDQSGLEFCRTLRSESDIPIVILSARTEEVDRVLGLELGADDYITKPFSPRELVSRVRAVLRMTGVEARRESSVVRI